MNKKYAELLIEMKDMDQDLRYSATPGRGVMNYMIYVVDFVHGERLQKLVDKYGYPTEELVGEEALAAAWLLVQHQDYNLDLQKEFLENCDFSDKNYAYLYDRVAINSGEKQRYGTQFKRDEDGKLTPRETEDPENVDKRREEKGLEPLEEHIKTRQKTDRFSEVTEEDAE